MNKAQIDRADACNSREDRSCGCRGIESNSTKVLKGKKRKREEGVLHRTEYRTKRRSRHREAERRETREGIRFCATNPVELLAVKMDDTQKLIPDGGNTRAIRRRDQLSQSKLPRGNIKH